MPSESVASLNNSALYDPPHIDLIPGMEYQFQNGKITGTGQRFHSHYSYVRAGIIGSETK